jgi:trk system potassium uptake protein TrkA
VETEHQAQAIRMIGATNVVFPERDTALQLVRSLMYPGLADQIALGEDFSVLDVPCPPQFDGQSLAALNLRRKHHVTLLATKLPATAEHSERMNINPTPDEPLDADSHLIVVGSHKRLTQFRRWAAEQTGAALSERELQLAAEPEETDPPD